MAHQLGWATHGPALLLPGRNSLRKSLLGGTRKILEAGHWGDAAIVLRATAAPVLRRSMPNISTARQLLTLPQGECSKMRPQGNMASQACARPAREKVQVLTWGEPGSEALLSWWAKGSASELVEGGPEGSKSPLMRRLMPLSSRRPRPPMKLLLCEAFTDTLNACTDNNEDPFACI